MDRRSALILYGSETGNAQDIAASIADVVDRLHFLSCVLSLDSVSIVCAILLLPHCAYTYQESLQDYDLIVFSVATTGQGDFPANSRKLWRSLLRKKLGPETFHGVKYALFGLGDSSYPKLVSFV
jgi:flavodoxin